MDTSLRAALRSFQESVNRSTAQANKIGKGMMFLSNQLQAFAKNPIMKDGLGALNTLGDQLKKLDPLFRQSLATNKSLFSTISKDMIGQTVKLGVGLEDLAKDVIALREKGIDKLSKGTIDLIGRMRATGQSTESLINFLGTNSSYLLLNQKQSQQLATDIATYSQVYSARQDEMIALAVSLSKTFQLQGLLGSGGQMTQAFTSLAASLGGGKAPLVDQFAGFFQKASLSQLQLLNIAEGFEQGIAATTDPEAQRKILIDALRQAGGQITALSSGYGTSTADRKMLEATLKPYGGEGALVIPQLLKALEDVKSPVYDFSRSITTFAGLLEVAATPFKILATALGELLDTGVGKALGVGLAGFVGVAGPFFAAIKLMRMASLVSQTAASINALSARIMRNAADKNMAAASASRFGGLLGPIGIIIGLLGAGYTLWESMNSETEEINSKTVDPRARDLASASLTSQIFTQLGNVITMRQNAGQTELISATNKLVSLAEQQAVWTNPNNAPVGSPRRGNK